MIRIAVIGDRRKEYVEQDSIETALEGIAFARTHGRPFLGTCAGFRHGVLEVARNVLGAESAAHREYGEGGDLLIDERHREPLASAGLLVAGVDAAHGGTRIMRLAGHPFFYLTLFVPHAASTPERPHPLVTGFLAAAAHVVGRV